MAVTDTASDVAMEAVVALAGRRAGKSLREIAIGLWGRERVEADWHADGGMRAKLRRLLRRAEAR